MNTLDLSRVRDQTERNFKLTPYHISNGLGLKLTLWWTSDEELASENPYWNIIAHFSDEPSLVDKKDWLARALIREWVEENKPNIEAMMRRAYRQVGNVLYLDVLVAKKAVAE